MPAFTHLCKKVNISLWHDTLTVHVKKSGEKSVYITGLLWGGPRSVINYDCSYLEMGQLVRDERKTHILDIKHFVLHNETDHYLYHQDDFEQTDEHYHAQFDAPITETRLKKILTTFVKYEVISEDEKNQFIKAYQLADLSYVKENGSFAQWRNDVENSSSFAIVSTNRYRFNQAMGSDSSDLLVIEPRA